MQIKNCRISWLFFSLGLVAGCEAAQKLQEQSETAQVASGNAPSATVAESSEGIVGPDEAFFAENYLEQIFHYSKENSTPTIGSETALSSRLQPTSGFDFAANFSDKRISLMVKSLLIKGDSDRDGALDDSEFANLKLDPAILGAFGNILTHTYSAALFAQIAGDDGLIQPEECGQWLRELGPAVKAVLDRQSPQDQRLKLVRAWEKVLGRYDADQNGKLSLQEQRDLRQDRAQLLGRLTEAPSK